MFYAKWPQPRSTEVPTRWPRARAKVRIALMVLPLAADDVQRLPQSETSIKAILPRSGDVSWHPAFFIIDKTEERARQDQQLVQKASPECVIDSVCLEVGVRFRSAICSACRPRTPRQLRQQRLSGNLCSCGSLCLCLLGERSSLQHGAQYERSQ